MTQQILKDGTDQEIYTTLQYAESSLIFSGDSPSSTSNYTYDGGAVSTNSNFHIDGGGTTPLNNPKECIGSTNGDVLLGINITFHEYKKPNVTFSNPDIIWDAANYSWKIIIPEANITQYGPGVLTPLNIDLINPTNIFFNTVDIISRSDLESQAIEALSTYNVPTKTELDTAVSPLATTTSILALNNISEDQILSQVSSALNTYNAPTKAEFNAAIDLIPTSSEILSTFNNEIIDGTYTRIQVERIIAAVLTGIRTKSDGRNIYTGLDGATARLVSESSPNTRVIVSRNGD